MKMITEKSYIEKYTRSNGSIGYRTMNVDVTMANSDGVEEADINNIVRNYNKTGHWPLSSKTGFYSGEEGMIMPNDLIAAHALISGVTDKFNQLPSKIRERFSNNPIELHNFLSNPSNLLEAEKLGLVTIARPNNDDSNDDDLAANTSKAPKKASSPKKSDPE